MFQRHLQNLSTKVTIAMFPHLQFTTNYKWPQLPHRYKGDLSTEHLTADCKQIAVIAYRSEGPDFKTKVTLLNEEYMAV